MNIKHNIQEEKINISFDTQEGSLSFPEVDLDTRTDIDFNELLIKLTDLIELNKTIVFEFIDETNLVKTSSKIKLIKETLEEIYTKYNTHVEDLIVKEIIVEEKDDDLPF